MKVGSEPIVTPFHSKTLSGDGGRERRVLISLSPVDGRRPRHFDLSVIAARNLVTRLEQALADIAALPSSPR